MRSSVRTVRPGEYGERLLADPDKYQAEVLDEVREENQRYAREVVERIFGPDVFAPPRRRWWQRAA